MNKGKCFVKPVKNGRPPVLTDELTKKVCNAILAGAYIETAVVTAGISKVVFYHWCKIAHGKIKKKLKNGEKVKYSEEERKPYKRFLNAVLKAMEDCEMRDLYNIDQCAMGSEVEYMRDKNGSIVYAKNGRPIVLKPGSPRDWQASAWRLIRRNPHRWNPSTKIEATGSNGGPIQTQEVEETVEEKKARQDRVRSMLERMSALRG